MREDGETDLLIVCQGAVCDTVAGGGDSSRAMSQRITTPSKINRALCRIKLSPVTHVLVDTWMLTVEPAYKLSNVPDGQTHM